MRIFVRIALLIGLLIGAGYSVTLDRNIGSNWAAPQYHKKSGISRDASVSSSPDAGMIKTSAPVYSTLPDSTIQQNSNVNSFGNSGAHYVPVDNAYYNYQVDPQQTQGQQAQSQDVYSYHPQPQQQEHGFAFPGQEGGFQGGFENTNEIQESESPGFFGGLMNSILENTGLGAILNTMREMWSNVTGGSDFSGIFGNMRTVMMGAMALPFMLPMTMLPIGMGILGLMAFPILQLTLPGIRRSMSDTATLTQNVLRSEECVERFSCNLARMTRKIPYDGIFSRFEKSDNKWLTRVSKSVKAARSGDDCKRFTCAPVTRMQNMVRSYLLGDKVEEQTVITAKSAN